MADTTDDGGSLPASMACFEALQALVDGESADKTLSQLVESVVVEFGSWGVLALREVDLGRPRWVVYRSSNVDVSLTLSATPSGEPQCEPAVEDVRIQPLLRDQQLLGHFIIRRGSEAAAVDERLGVVAGDLARVLWFLARRRAGERAVARERRRAYPLTQIVSQMGMATTTLLAELESTLEAASPAEAVQILSGSNETATRMVALVKQLKALILG